VTATPLTALAESPEILVLLGTALVAGIILWIIYRT
jgi:hypothetical protein